MQNNETHFLLIVAIIGAGLWLRHSLTPSYGWIVVILVGSLLEAVYMFGWFKQATRAVPNEAPVRPTVRALSLSSSTPM